VQKLLSEERSKKDTNLGRVTVSVRKRRVEQGLDGSLGKSVDDGSRETEAKKGRSRLRLT